MSYPCPEVLRRSLLDHLHDHICSNISATVEPVAAKLYATRFLTPELEGTALVDAMKEANENLVRGVRTAHQKQVAKYSKDNALEGMAAVYAEFVREWFEKDFEYASRNSISSHLCSNCVLRPQSRPFLSLISIYQLRSHIHRPRQQRSSENWQRSTLPKPQSARKSG